MAKELSALEKSLLKSVADIEQIPVGAFSFRKDGETVQKSSSENIEIVAKTDKPGIDIIIKSSTKGERVDLPVIITKSGVTDLVYNDFYVEDGADVTIVAGCGIHNPSCQTSSHDGIHTFHIGKNAKAKYIEKHYGEGSKEGKKILNPQTIIFIAEGGYFEMDSAQIGGVDSTNRITSATLEKKATLIVHEKIMTNFSQVAKTDFTINLNGEDSATHVVSRSVAKDTSYQEFTSLVNGNEKCSGRTECDAIIMDSAKVSAIPKINANHLDASLIHEAAIGKIAGEQLVKLMSLGLTEQEAEEQIINGFLK